jgi:hypothetical protein
MAVRQETEEGFIAPTDYAKKHGVTRIGHKQVYDADRIEHGIQICNESITTWYFDEKEPEPLKGIRLCVTIPDAFLMQIKKEFGPPGEPSNDEVIRRLETWVEDMKYYTDAQYGKGDIKQLIENLKEQKER